MASTDAPQPAKGPLEATCAAALDEWRSAGLERRPASFSSAQDPVSVVDGERLVNFASANYLGLATHPRVVEAAAAAARRLGAGSGGSRLTAGTTDLHLELEAELASWLGYPDAVLFGSGFSANVGLLGALGEKGRLVCSDAANHASIIDGARAARQAGAGLAVYPHLDATAAEEALAAAPDALGIVVTDGLFSMSGDLAPIAKLSRAARRRGAALVVDDAHGIGVLGAAGRGAFEEAGAERPDVLVGALSKALGGEAGFVCASKEVCELLRQKARTYVFSTALAAPAVAAGLAAVRLAAGEPERRGRLARLTTRLRGGLKEAGIPALPGTGPIVAVPAPGAGVAVTAARRLRGAGLFAPAIRYPTVPRGGEIVRVTLMATHTEEHVDRLVEELAGALAAPAGT